MKFETTTTSFKQGGESRSRREEEKIRKWLVSGQVYFGYFLSSLVHPLEAGCPASALPISHLNIYQFHPYHSPSTPLEPPSRQNLKIKEKGKGKEKRRLPLLSGSHCLRGRLKFIRGVVHYIYF